MISIAKKKLLIIESRRFDLQLAQRIYYNCFKKNIENYSRISTTRKDRIALSNI
jgi:hypothetical protein